MQAFFGDSTRSSKSGCNCSGIFLSQLVIRIVSVSTAFLCERRSGGCCSCNLELLLLELHNGTPVKMESQIMVRPSHIGGGSAG